MGVDYNLILSMHNYGALFEIGRVLLKGVNFVFVVGIMVWARPSGVCVKRSVAHELHWRTGKWI